MQKDNWRVAAVSRLHVLYIDGKVRCGRVRGVNQTSGTPVSVDALQPGLATLSEKETKQARVGSEPVGGFKAARHARPSLQRELNRQTRSVSVPPRALQKSLRDGISVTGSGIVSVPWRQSACSTAA
jgi:hypothetical protein